MDNVLARLDGAGHFVGGRWLLRGIDLTINSGEIISLIGPNGSGKTTLARLVLGLLRADEGSSYRRSGLRVGYVPQDLTIDWALPLDVRRLMNLTGFVSDIGSSLDRVGASGLIDRPVSSLSGGEFRRILLARALSRRPDFLVLDEPVRGVDISGESDLYDLIISARNELGCGVLMISHDLHIVMAATDRVICMNGHICCEGKPDDVARSDEFENLFGSVAVAPYRHRHDHSHLPDGSVTSPPKKSKKSSEQNEEKKDG